MKKMLIMLVTVLICIMGCTLPINANQNDSDFISYQLGETYSVSSLESEELTTIYEFTLLEDSILNIEIDFKFENVLEKTVYFQIQPMLNNEEMLGGGIPNIEIESLEYEKIIKDDKYYINENCYFKAGTYFFTVGAEGIFNEDISESEHVNGTACFTLSVAEKNNIDIQTVTFRFRNSKWGNVPSTKQITYVNGGVVPTYFTTMMPELQRNNYELAGFYAYRKRDNSWLYAEKISRYDPEYDIIIDDYQNFGWYPLNKAPEGYERYYVYNDGILGNDSFVMNSMQNNDEIILRDEWKGNPYVVRYHANVGGKGTMKNSYFEYGKAKKLRANNYTNKNKLFYGWKCRRSSDDKWLYTNGSKKAWYKESKAPKGWTKYIFNNKETIKNLASESFEVLHMYAIWR